MQLLNYACTCILIMKYDFFFIEHIHRYSNILRYLTLKLGIFCVYRFGVFFKSKNHVLLLWSIISTKKLVFGKMCIISQKLNLLVMNRVREFLCGPLDIYQRSLLSYTNVSLGMEDYH